MASIGIRFTEHQVTPAGRTMLVTTLALGWVLSLLIAALISAEAMLDPGGTAGIVLTVAWGLPAMAFIVLGFTAPHAARWILGIATGVLLIAGIAPWIVADPLARFQAEHGPVLFVAGFAVWLGLLALGAVDPPVAGILLLLSSLGPVALELLQASATGQSSLQPSQLSIALPYAIIGVALLVATSLAPADEEVDSHPRQPPG